MHLWPRLAWLVLFEGLHCLKQVVAQTSDVVCLPSFNWAFNTLDQSPCIIGAYLQSVCSPNFNIPALPDGNHYTGPAFNTANACSCSTVTYSLISACGACQGRTFQSWGNWSTNCPDPMKSIATFPNTIPALTSVPNWAFLDVEESNDTFDPARAESLVRNGPPESTGSPAPRSTATTTIATDVQSTLTSPPGPSQTSASRDQTSGVNAGAVAGGIVGGIAFIAIVAVGSFWYCTKKSRNRPPQPTMYSPSLVVPATATSPPMTSMATPPIMTSPGPSNAYLLQRKTHASNTSIDSFIPPAPDHSDSSNYASRVSPAVPSIYTTYDPYSRASMDNLPHNGQGRGYSGAPEV